MKKKREYWLPKNFWYQMDRPEEMYPLLKHSLKGKLIFYWCKYRAKLVDKYIIAYMNTSFQIFIEERWAAIKYFFYQAFGFEIYAYWKARYVDYMYRNYVFADHGRRIGAYYILVLFIFVYAVNLFAFMDLHLHQSVKDTTRLVF